MFLDTNVTDLLKKKIWVTELIFEKNSKNCDIFGYHYQKYGTFCSRFSCQRLSPFYIPNVA
jgi:hypothetical protein